MTWSGLGANTLPVADSDEAYQELRLLDILPDVVGFVDAGGSTTSLIDDEASFMRDFGHPDSGEVLDRTLLDLATGASCNGFRVVSETSLECDEPLKGREDDPGFYTFEEGHRYIISGDEFALRYRLFSGLISATSILDSLDSPEATATLAGIDATPGALAPERDELWDDLQKVRDQTVQDVTTLQKFHEYLGDALNADDYDGTIAITLLAGTATTPPSLHVSVSKEFEGRLATVPLLITADPPLLTQHEDLRVPLEYDSKTTIGVGIDLDDGHLVALGDTGTVTNVAADHLIVAPIPPEPEPDSTTTTTTTTAPPSKPAMLGAAEVNVTDLEFHLDATIESSLGADDRAGRAGGSADHHPAKPE